MESVLLVGHVRIQAESASILRRWRLAPGKETAFLDGQKGLETAKGGSGLERAIIRMFQIQPLHRETAHVHW